MTLIEVIVALLIFSFGLLGLVGLQGRAHTFAMSAEDSNRAALLADEIVTSSVLTANLATNGGAVGTATLATPSATDWSASAAAVLPNGTVSFGTMLSGSKRLPVKIFWKSPTAASGAASNSYQTEAILP